MESNKQQSQKHILMPQYSVEVEDYLDQVFFNYIISLQFDLYLIYLIRK